MMMDVTLPPGEWLDYADTSQVLSGKLGRFRVPPWFYDADAQRLVVHVVP
jgi:hypothetical protein